MNMSEAGSWAIFHVTVTWFYSYTPTLSHYKITLQLAKDGDYWLDQQIFSFPTFYLFNNLKYYERYHA